MQPEDSQSSGQKQKADAAAGESDGSTCIGMGTEAKIDAVASGHSECPAPALAPAPAPAPAPMPAPAATTPTPSKTGKSKVFGACCNRPTDDEDLYLEEVQVAVRDAVPAAVAVARKKEQDGDATESEDDEPLGMRESSSAVASLAQGLKVTGIISGINPDLAESSHAGPAVAALPADGTLEAESVEIDTGGVVHGSQREVAEQILDVMERFSGDGSEYLSQCGFTDLAWYIQLPKMNSLYQQTGDRVAAFLQTYARSLPDFFPGMIEAAAAAAATAAAADKRADKNSWLDPYLIKASGDSEDTRSRIENLKERIRNEPHTLFLIIQDEAHYEMVKGKAADLFTNSDEIRLSKNVRTLYVSATPYTIFTKQSQVPARNTVPMDKATESGSKKYYGMTEFCKNLDKWGPGFMTDDSLFEARIAKEENGVEKDKKRVRGDVLTTEYICALVNARQKEEDVRMSRQKAKLPHGNDQVSWQTNEMAMDLLTSKDDGKGVMILIRADFKENADRLCKYLKRAREKCGLKDRFAVILDHDDGRDGRLKDQIPRELQRKMAGWKKMTVDSLDVGSYEDLEGLPCVLILVQKGKMGDSFPKSLRYCELNTSIGANRCILLLIILKMPLQTTCDSNIAMQFLFALHWSRISVELAAGLKKLNRARWKQNRRMCSSAASH